MRDVLSGRQHPIDAPRRDATARTIRKRRPKMKRFLIALSVLAALTMPASALNCSTGAGELGKAPCVFTVDNRTIIKGLCEVSESGDGRGIDIFLGRQHAALGWNGNGAPGPHNGWWEVSWNHGASFVSPADDDFSRDMKVIGRIRDNG
jgi:hypothetical protein